MPVGSIWGTEERRRRQGSSAWIVECNTYTVASLWLEMRCWRRKKRPVTPTPTSVAWGGAGRPTTDSGSEDHTVTVDDVVLLSGNALRKAAARAKKRAPRDYHGAKLKREIDDLLQGGPMLCQLGNCRLGAVPEALHVVVSHLACNTYVTIVE